MRNISFRKPYCGQTMVLKSIVKFIKMKVFVLVHTENEVLNNGTRRNFMKNGTEHFRAFLICTFGFQITCLG